MIRPLLCALIVVSGGGLLTACGPDTHVPAPSSDAYGPTVSHFYKGVIALETGEDAIAARNLEEAARRAPGEPAVWANRAILAYRRGNLEEAAEYQDRALALHPDHPRFLYLAGRIALEQDREDEGAALLRRAVEAGTDSTLHLPAAHRLYQLLRARDESEEAGRLLRRMRAAAPENLALSVEAVERAGRGGAWDRASALFDELVVAFPAEARSYGDLTSGVRRALETRRTDSLSHHVQLLGNLLKQSDAYRADLRSLNPPPGQGTAVVHRPFVLAPPDGRPDPRDDSLTFAPEVLVEAPEGGARGDGRWADYLMFGADGPPVRVAVWGDRIRIGDGVPEEGTSLPFPGSAEKAGSVEGSVAGAEEGAAPLPPNAVTALDYDYDFRRDLAAAGPGGGRLYRRTEAAGEPGAESGGESTGESGGEAGFEDVSEEALPEAARTGSFVGVWKADLDADGDLDLVFGQETGPPLVLRNRGDGTFEVSGRFEEIDGLRDLVWADRDGDGDADVTVLDRAGRLHRYDRSREAPAYRYRGSSKELPGLVAIELLGRGPSGRLAMLALARSGTVLRLTRSRGANAWTVGEVASFASSTRSTADASLTRSSWGSGSGETDSVAYVPGRATLDAPDIDNNGGRDLVVSAGARTAVWLSGRDGGYHLLTERSGARVYGARDTGGRGRLDLVGIGEDGSPTRWVNRGTRTYRSLTLRLQAMETRGDRRINPFALGSQVEVRAGLLYQQQVLLEEPVAHLGLGDRTRADAIRIIWPNGEVRALFDQPASQLVRARQQMKGSCPHLFAFDGSGVRFVKDAAPWSPAIGLRVNAQETAGIATPREWFKVPGSALAPRRSDSARARTGSFGDAQGSARAGSPSPDTTEAYYDLRITADLWETYYVDQYGLMAVDHPEGTEIWVDERALPPPERKILLTGPARPFARVIDTRGREVTERVRARDRRFVADLPLGPYQGLAASHHVEITLGEEVPEGEAVVLLAQGWLYPTTASINLALSQRTDGPRRPDPLALQVPDGQDGWRTVAENLGFPAGKRKTMVLPLRELLGGGDWPDRIRLTTNMEIYWDALRWAEVRPDSLLRVRRLPLAGAVLRHRGTSEMHPLIDRNDRRRLPAPTYRPVAHTARTWPAQEGFFTRYGPIEELLTEVDDRYAIFTEGDEVRLRFAAPAAPPEGTRRDFVFVGDGWIKDGDVNSRYSRTVRPLPIHGKTVYDSKPEHLTDEPAYRKHPTDWIRYHTRYLTGEPFRAAMRRGAGP